ncbi:MAG: hypothetical protein DRH51_08330, partial [Candidatus Coatesbacteria bacterium]
TYGNKFIRISSGTPLDTGGSDTHTHSLSGHTHTVTVAHSGWSYTSHSGAKDILMTMDADPNQDYMTDADRTFTSSAPSTDTTGSANNIPVYVQLRMYKKD